MNPDRLLFNIVPEFEGNDLMVNALQSFEAGLALVAMGRYTQALAPCVAAVESCLWAGLGVTRDERAADVALPALLARAVVAKPALEVFLQDIPALCSGAEVGRHYGYSPRDNDEAAALMLKTVWPLFAACLWEFYALRMLRVFDGHIAQQIAIAEEVYPRMAAAGVSAGVCLIGVKGMVGRLLQDEFLSGWQQGLLETAMFGEAFDDLEKNRERMSRPLKAPWTFSCPVCGQPWLLCEMNNEALDAQLINIEYGKCLACGLHFPKDAVFLSNRMTEDEREEEKPKIFKELGIEAE